MMAPADLPAAEIDAVGYAKRLDFVAAAIADLPPKRVLDMGCGTGAMLTAPLARLFPSVAFVGVDDDADSIGWAAEHLTAANLDFRLPGGVAADDRFDLVIASEVLEHVTDPASFLASLAGRLTEGGRLLLTVPNGHGPSEIMALLEALATLSGAQRLLGGLKRRLLGQARAAGGAATLAVSPHVQSFGLGDLHHLFAETGLKVLAFRPRTLLCGWLLDSLVRATRLGRQNAAAADRLPSWCASDWMFVLERIPAANSPAPWQPSPLARLRRRLILRRWGIAPAAVPQEAPMTSLNDQVRAFWEQGPCGTSPGITGDLEPLSKEWFERVEQVRYEREPMIHGVAQFTRHRGKRILEIGVGAGTDHLQWARAGAECHGVDLTQAAIDTTRARLALYGFESDLQRHDAETLPFPDNHFDIVWSWGVIHHSETPERIVAEIHRVLKPGGQFLGMLYKRRCLAVFKEWIKWALLKGQPLRSFADVMWHHFESVGTKAYEPAEMAAMFAAFSQFRCDVALTPYDCQHFPAWLHPWFPQGWGAFLDITATK